MHDVLINEPQPIQDAVLHLVSMHAAGRRTNRSGIQTLALLLVADGGDFGTVLLSGCDSFECRAAAIALAETIHELPRTSIN